MLILLLPCQQDVLLHSGDLSELGGIASMQGQFEWLKYVMALRQISMHADWSTFIRSTLPHRFKFVIAGNHDFALCTRENWYETRGRELLQQYKGKYGDPEIIKKVIKEWEAHPDRVQRYLEDEKAEFELKGRKWSIYGSPWTPEFEDWAWNYKRGSEAKREQRKGKGIGTIEVTSLSLPTELYSKLPSTDILLTHGPPHKIGGLDLLTDRVTSVGCEELTERMERGDVRPLLYCFGHIHGEDAVVRTSPLGILADKLHHSFRVTRNASAVLEAIVCGQSFQNAVHQFIHGRL
jgi:hypothetical protein